MTAKYGYAALNQSTSKRSQGFNILGNLKEGTTIIPVRVLSIVLDENHPRFKELGEWNALGAIEYQLVEDPTKIAKPYPIAVPLTPNTKNYPLVNEIVYLIALPNTGVGETNVSKVLYYISIVSLWNHPHQNAYPSISNEPTPPQQKDYLQTQAGSTQIITENNGQIFLGDTFDERQNIHPLLPFEGDVIYEGRWGNSIRLGSTVNNSVSKIQNNWSSTGKNGDPITIIRNGQGDQTKEGWVPIVEDINNAESSIYITSTQKIPLNALSTSYVSYNKDKTPTSPDQYSGAQIILNSGRLVFSSWNDHILLSSAKSINLNSLESVNIDTKKFITQADNIFLGKEELAIEPLLLGNATVMLLRDLIDSVQELVGVLQNLESDPVSPGIPATFLNTLPIQTAGIITCLNSLENQLGYSQETCTITSKRNFTV